MDTNDSNGPSIEEKLPIVTDSTFEQLKNEKIDLSKYVYACGRSFDSRRSFIAIRFTKKLIRLSFNQRRINPADFPEDCIIILHGRPPSNYFIPNSSLIAERKLIFRKVCSDQVYDGTIHVQQSSQYALLRELFPEDSILFDVYYNNVLYVFANKNPFRSSWTCNRKCMAYKTLCLYADLFLNRETRFSITEIAKYRFFKKHSRDPSKFPSWAQFAREFYRERINKHVPEFDLTASNAARVYRSLKYNTRCNLKNLPPKTFYKCEMTLRVDIPVGIAFNFDLRTNSISYVSPMIVSLVKTKYKDTNGVECGFTSNNAYCRVNNWFALFKDKKTWEYFGFKHYYYVTCSNKMFMLNTLINWLSIQREEKYQLMYEDLCIVYGLLATNEEEARRWQSHR